MFHHPFLRQSALRCAALAAIIVLTAACGDDGDATTNESATTDAPASDDSTISDDAGPASDDASTDTSDDGSTTSDSTGETGTDDEGQGEGQAPPTTEAAPSTTTFASGEETSADGTTVSWQLTGDADELCFEAELVNADSTIAGTLGNGVSECLRPADGLDAITEPLVTDVGTVDGGRRFGYLWGRVGADVATLTIVANDGTTTPIELRDGATDVQVFAYVGVIDDIAPVLTLDAGAGAEVVDSEPIRDFLRTGPTYPTVPPITVPPVSYPTVN